MVRFHHILTILLLAALLVSACRPIVAQESVTTPEPTTPSFLPTGCLYRTPPDANVECGFLLTREVHSNPSSRIIRLHVIIIKSTAETPQSTPLVILNGGPGSPNEPVVNSILFDRIGAVWLSMQDVIVIDQRGTNYSLPSLNCPTGLPFPESHRPLTHEVEAAWEYVNLQLCYTALLGEGINLSAYNLFESAADINDLRLALGYEQVKLFGYSYGSLLAMTVMREYPDAVHSAILDSILPLGTDLRCERIHCLQSGLDAFFAACNRDASCSAAYPALETTFWNVVDRLHASPVEMVLPFAGEEYHIQLDDQIFLRYVFLMLQENQISRLPAIIASAAHGDYDDPARAWLAYALMQGQETRLGNSSAAGLYYSTMCSYLDAFTISGDLVPSRIDDTKLVDPYLERYSNAAFQPCDFWEVTPVPTDDVLTMAQSQIPTLLLVGAFDPGLAPYLNEAVLPLLSHHYLYELPMSHGAIFSRCGLFLTFEFLTDPMQTPDAACIDDMGIRWVLPQESKGHE